MGCGRGWMESCPGEVCVVCSSCGGWKDFRSGWLVDDCPYPLSPPLFLPRLVLCNDIISLVDIFFLFFSLPALTFVLCLRP